MDRPPTTPWETRAATIVDWCAAGAIALGLLLLTLGKVQLGSWMLIAFLVVHFSVKYLAARGRHKELETLRSLGFRLCPHCRYDLTRSEPAGACPECGKAYDAESLERDWRRALRVPKAKLARAGKGNGPRTGP